MEHSVLGAMSYFGIFLFIYIVIWISQYSAIKKRIQQINERIQKKDLLCSPLFRCDEKSL